MKKDIDNGTGSEKLANGVRADKPVVVAGSKDKSVKATSSKDKSKKKAQQPSREVVKRILPETESTWILQPTGVTVMRYDFDTTQTKILVTIVQRLQEAIKAAINHQSEDVQLELFAQHKFSDERIVGKDEVLIHMKINDFGVDPRRYNDLKNAMTALSEQTVWIPIVDDDGRRFEMAKQIFTPILPKEKYNKDVYIKMSRENALRFINVDLGYHRYLKEVVFETRNKYVQRIYMYIRSWINVNRQPVIKISDLRLMLKLEDKYPRWNMFYRKVIEPAEQELKEKAATGQVDCYFTVEKIYKKGTPQRGEPDSLQFNILKGSVDMEPEMEAPAMSDAMKELEDLLRKEFGFRGSMTALMDRIGDENAAAVADSVSEWKNYILNHDVKNPAGFVSQCILNLIGGPEDKLTADVSSIKGDKAAGGDKATDSGVQGDNPEDDLPAVDAVVVERFRSNLRAHSSEQDWATWLSFIGLAGVGYGSDGIGQGSNGVGQDGDGVSRGSDGIVSVTLSFPSVFFQSVMQSQFKDVILDAVTEVFGEVELYFVVMKQ